MAKPFRVEMRLKNNALIEAREQTGLNLSQFAEHVGLHPGDYSGLETMRISPLRTRKLTGGRVILDWSKVALRVADALGLSPDLLWPHEVRNVAGAGRATVKLDTPEVVQLLSVTQEHGDDRHLLPGAVEEVLTTLTPKEQAVLRLRFGLEGADEAGSTLDGIAEGFGVSRERIRQIEARALRKLRHPSRAKILRPAS